MSIVVLAANQGGYNSIKEKVDNNNIKRCIKQRYEEKTANNKLFK